jgi:hypothetical protein
MERQEAQLMFVKREQWTEEDVVGLPQGEHDYFDRKSGRVFDNPNDRNGLLDVLAKQGSAFANSGGGHLILGVNDDGSFDGAPELISGRTTTRDWLEQKIPELLDYRLNDFRVHAVVPSEQSAIPAGRLLIIVDFGDSALAPHQSRRHATYFYRSAGRSIAAPHFYLELLRQRLTNAVLDFDLVNATIQNAWALQGSGGALVLLVEMEFLIKNTGRVAAYKWALSARSISNIPDGRGDDYHFGAVPGAPGRSTSIRVDDTVLPGCSLIEKKLFGVVVRPASKQEPDVRAEVVSMLSNLTCALQLATETSPGEPKEVVLGTNFSVDPIVQLLRAQGLIDNNTGEQVVRTFPTTGPS